MKNKRKILVGAAMVCSMMLVTSCKKTNANETNNIIPNTELAPENDLGAKLASIVDPTTITGATYMPDIVYNTASSATKFDLFIPNTASATNPASLVIYVHGGGFVSGDKSDAYSNAYADDIQYYMNNNIAFATVNYRFKTDFLPGITDEGQQVLSCMNDVKRCLQFIRFNAGTYKINKLKVGMYGGSAGGASSIWLAFKNEMANSTAVDLVLRESTRIQAVGHINSQATYSPSRLATIFSPYGCTILNATTTYAPLDFISFVSIDDPEIFIYQPRTDIACTNTLHHPVQAKALHDKVVLIGVPRVSYIPAFSIGVDPQIPANESLSEFMKRKL
jgi:hypothetical protein